MTLIRKFEDILKYMIPMLPNSVIFKKKAYVCSAVRAGSGAAWELQLLCRLGRGGDY